MSNLLLEDLEGFQFLKRFNISPPLTICHPRYDYQSSLPTNIFGSSGRQGREEPATFSSFHNEVEENRVLMQQNGGSPTGLKGLLVMSEDRRRHKVSMKCYVLRQEDQYFKLENHRVFNDLCKYLPTLAGAPFSTARVFISPETKQITLNLPIYSKKQLALLDMIPNLPGKTKFSTLFNLMIRPHLTELLGFVQGYQEGEPLAPHNNSRVKNLTHSITRYKHMLHI